MYYAIIPDKNYFLTEKKGYPTLDYDRLFREVKEGFAGIEGMVSIDLLPLLSIEDYYKTDMHWRQEKITDVAKHIGESMGVSLTENHKVIETEGTLNSTYYGRIPKELATEKIFYVEGQWMKECRVYDYEKEKEIPMYHLSLAETEVSYDMFLDGARPVITIENPNGLTQKELVIFRDSFGSSIAPLLAEAYSKVTILDIRYLNITMIDKFVEFKDQDVLFLYSTTVLNNRSSFR